VADAEKINENFEGQYSRILEMEARYSSVNEEDSLFRGWQLFQVDCTEDPDALRNLGRDILTGRTNVHVKISGDCIGSDDDGISISGKRIFLDGGIKYNDDYTSECESTSILRHAVAGERLNISINSASTLYLGCITFSGGANLGAYANSYIRTEIGVNANEDGMAILLRGNSLYRTFRTSTPTSFRAWSGSTIEIQNETPISIPSLSLRESRLVCTVCAGNIGDIELSNKSVASISAFSELRLEGVAAYNESTFILRDLSSPFSVELGTIGAYQGSSIILQKPDCEHMLDVSSISADSRLIRYSDQVTPCEN
jgi:hypothetical protein